MQVNLDVAVLATQGGKGSILIDHVAQNFHINGSAFQEVPDVCDFRGKSVLCNHGLSEAFRGVGSSYLPMDGSGWAGPAKARPRSLLVRSAPERDGTWPAS